MLIGEVARRSGVSSRMLRHYDTLGLVRPTGRTVGNYREYSADDIRRIFHVESLRSLGLSLREIGRALEDPAFAPAALVSDLIQRTEDRLRREQELLDRLNTVDASAPSGWEDVLRIIELLHSLDSPNAARRQQAALVPDAVPTDVLVKAVLTEADANVAGALRWALARADNAVTALAAGLESPDPAVRRRAVQAIVELPGDDATAVLETVLADDDPAIRKHATLALGNRGVTAAIPALVSMIVDGINDVEAAEILGTLAADPTVLTALTDALARSDSPARIRLTQALAELPRPIVEETLRRLSSDPDRVVALIAGSLLET
ncbi:MerR family transcriptional regulator [Kribbella antibiotica]|uniref:MerR family transcriptional regulator n=1 Tax=Kribbella antibiotica TaxID=190195 RepID=A0A4R4ZY14_9ACTN|nr:HEAT repeat domain-containing protein [Kribbella antibiotica]TDD63226.1 MerR family transcriptional regulator [Kribbella antibiotica]